ncbi:S-adenosyl-L-methionine-dependent methyltransferase [Trametes coccinea BRFM310]|uniref:Trimethylguanosine synthase n=1 Tax=Trametes coccinea (strain BRFM310) TaxID=1353009 RepID=A0A1Y2IWB2_TRAC3|nr:S-adenosyl-L-methionine-dependent methyltransferase [Trametes coccinea BRFM310]
MVKRKTAITGLSRFLAEATKSSELESHPPESAVENGVQVTTAASEVEVAASEELKHRVDAPSADTRPAKKPRLQAGLLGEGLEKYDATGLVPFYTDPSQVPEHLQKYFFQRERYFSKYSSGCLLDEEGWYSVTPERVADQIAERCRCDVILDAFCGVGGNAIAFARTCERVIALDVSPIRLALARHNAALYGVQDRIEFVLADFLSFARGLQTIPRTGTETNATRRKIDVVFLSPPWGGPSYIAGSPLKGQAPSSAQAVPEDGGDDTHAEFGLSSIRPIHGHDLFKVARNITRNVAYFLPRNTNLDEISQLIADDPAEKVEVEEEWMGSKLKALTCYFGGLASGQEATFDD